MHVQQDRQLVKVKQIVRDQEVYLEMEHVHVQVNLD
jgi:hypothetical protein